MPNISKAVFKLFSSPIKSYYSKNEDVKKLNLSNTQNTKENVKKQTDTLFKSVVGEDKPGFFTDIKKHAIKSLVKDKFKEIKVEKFNDAYLAAVDRAKTDAKKSNSSTANPYIFRNKDGYFAQKLLEDASESLWKQHPEFTQKEIRTLLKVVYNIQLGPATNKENVEKLHAFSKHDSISNVSSKIKTLRDIHTAAELEYKDNLDIDLKVAEEEYFKYRCNDRIETWYRKDYKKMQIANKEIPNDKVTQTSISFEEFTYKLVNSHGANPGSRTEEKKHKIEALNNDPYWHSNNEEKDFKLRFNASAQKRYEIDEEIKEIEDTKIIYNSRIKKIDEFLSNHPNHVEASQLKIQNETALQEANKRLSNSQNKLSALKRQSREKYDKISKDKYSTIIE